MKENYRLKIDSESEWQSKALQTLASQGFVIIENVLPQSMVETASESLSHVAENYNLNPAIHIHNKQKYII